MLSRVANSVYWLHRYIERAGNVARFIDVNENLTLGEDDALGTQWSPLVSTTGDEGEFYERYKQPTRDNVLHFLAFDEQNPNSIASCVANARENARTIREVLPSVVWKQLNEFYFMVRSAAQFRASRDEPQEFCERVRLASHLLVGATDATMSQGEAWHFSRLGRLIERADKTSRIVDVQYYLLLPDGADVGSALDVVRWAALLKSATALEMYRREHGKIVPRKVAGFLILDRHFPRSMRFCLIKAQQSLQQITGSQAGTFCNSAEQQMGLLCSILDYTSIDDIIRSGLHEFVDAFQVKLNRVGAAIHNDFFTFQPSQAQAAGQMRQTQSS